MLRRNMPRLFVRLLILTTLVSALLLTSTGVTRNTVYATDPVYDPFCTVCQGYYEACAESCPALGEPGHFSCMLSCRNEQRECEIVFCGCWRYDGLCENRPRV